LPKPARVRYEYPGGSYPLERSQSVRQSDSQSQSQGATPLNPPPASHTWVFCHEFHSKFHSLSENCSRTRARVWLDIFTHFPGLTLMAMPGCYQYLEPERERDERAFFWDFVRFLRLKGCFCCRRYTFTLLSPWRSFQLNYRKSATGFKSVGLLWGMRCVVLAKTSQESFSSPVSQLFV